MYLLIISLREALVGIKKFCGLVYVRVCLEIQQELKYVVSLQTARPLLQNRRTRPHESS